MPVKPKVFKIAKVGKSIRAKDSTWGNGRGGRPWRRKRDRILRRDGYECQTCLRDKDRHVFADEVDHIIPRAEGGTDDDSNLEAICIDHHKIKTAAEAKRGIERSRNRKNLIDLII